MVTFWAVPVDREMPSGAFFWPMAGREGNTMEEKKNGNGVGQDMFNLVHALKSMNYSEGGD